MRTYTVTLYDLSQFEVKAEDIMEALQEAQYTLKREEEIGYRPVIEIIGIKRELGI